MFRKRGKRPRREIGRPEMGRPYVAADVLPSEADPPPDDWFIPLHGGSRRESVPRKSDASPETAMQG